MALIEVYEGESAAARENAVVASITLPLVPAPFGSPNIQVPLMFLLRPHDNERPMLV